MDGADVASKLRQTTWPGKACYPLVTDIGISALNAAFARLGLVLPKGRGITPD